MTARAVNNFTTLAIKTISNMKNRILVLGLEILCIAFFSCNSGDSYYNPDDVIVDKNDDNIVTISLLHVKDLPSISRGLTCIDNYLILTQENRDSVFQVIDMTNGASIASFGKVGHARNEFSSIPFRVYCSRNEKGDPMLCIQQKLCTKIVDIKKSVETNNCVVSKIIKENKFLLFDYTFHFAENKWFNYKTVSYEDARDKEYIKPMFYMNDDANNEWDVFPQIITPTYSSLVDCAYAMNVLVSPNGKFAVGIHNFIDIVTIFDIDNHKSIGIVNPNSYTLKDMENEFNEDNFDDKVMWYNTSGWASNNSFMVIKAGVLYQNVAEDEDEEGTCAIKWYDWNGEKQASFIANKKLNYIAYNEKTDVLYAISYANKLYSCKLKNK